ncbi:hypothetical protein PVAP13_1KG447200 [Panicum virgatum]|uniref:Uncharacterized protein n=1 Tax=Panicum virgatum TaxID=38727 RepID=A0A8T0XZ69_PANVG|nr:hypothetical protein PVAP13_1KG447200 [Panicum virgatum]
MDPSGRRRRSKGTRAEVAGGEAISATPTAPPKPKGVVVPIEPATSASAIRPRRQSALSLRHNPGEAKARARPPFSVSTRPRTTVSARRRYKYLPGPPPPTPTSHARRVLTAKPIAFVRPARHCSEAPRIGSSPRRPSIDHQPVRMRARA